MRSRCLFGICGLFLLACCVREVLAQGGTGSVQGRGMFGTRTLGQTLAPRPSQFGSRIERGPSGNFLGRSTSGVMFTTPWRQTPVVETPYRALLTLGPDATVQVTPLTRILPAGLSPPEAAARAAALAAATETPAAPAAQLAQPQPVAPPAESEGQPATWFRSTGAEGGESGALGAPAVAEEAPPAPTMGRPRISLEGLAGPAGRAAQAGLERPVFSAVLSQQLTRSARAGGVTTSTGITVHLVNETAILQGRVATPRDRDLVANLALLEPGVWRIDNRLTVETGAAGRVNR